jgi:hypothetical protein
LKNRLKHCNICKSWLWTSNSRFKNANLRWCVWEMTRSPGQQKSPCMLLIFQLFVCSRTLVNSVNIGNNSWLDWESTVKAWTTKQFGYSTWKVCCLCWRKQITFPARSLVDVSF